jgi:hypothetical protein
MASRSFPHDEVHASSLRGGAPGVQSSRSRRPSGKTPSSPAAYVRWAHIHKLRELLPAAGYDYPAARKRTKEFEKTRRAAEKAAKMGVDR